jgi:hypothetical protein
MIAVVLAEIWTRNLPNDEASVLCVVWKPLKFYKLRIIPCFCKYGHSVQFSTVPLLVAHRVRLELPLTALQPESHLHDLSPHPSAHCGFLCRSRCLVRVYILPIDLSRGGVSQHNTHAPCWLCEGSCYLLCDSTHMSHPTFKCVA